MWKHWFSLTQNKFIYVSYRRNMWARTKSDLCAYNKEISQSTAPYYYTLDPNKFYNRNDCRVDLGVVGGNNVSLTKSNMVDKESDLFGINRPNSKCPERKFLPLPYGDELSGIQTPFHEPVDHLRECRMIDYAPRINNVGYRINYPRCARPPQGGVFPPQMNPTHWVDK